MTMNYVNINKIKEKWHEYQQKRLFTDIWGKNVNLKILKIYKWDISVLVKLLIDGDFVENELH